MTDYVEKLSKLPAHILHCADVTSFFLLTSSDEVKDDKLCNASACTENVSNNARVVSDPSSSADVSSSGQ